MKPITLTAEELAVVTDLIIDWGFQSSLTAEDIAPLAKRLGLEPRNGFFTTPVTISKDGRLLWKGYYKSRAEALAAYREELGAEALDYDAVDPNWTDELEVS